MIDEGSSDGDTLPLSSREFIGPVHHALLEIDGRERFFGHLVPLARANAAINERQLNIVERSRAREQVECLKDEADFLVSYTRQFVIIHLRYVLAVQPILTLRSRVETPNQVHQRGFA